MVAKMSAAAYSDQLELKCQERDLTILIGSEEKPYHYYSQFMAFGCELIDVMLSHDMKEKNDKVIRFPDISVDSWEEFQCYIYPNKDLEFSLHFAGRCEQAMELLPLAAKFLKKDVCDHCDNVMANRLRLSDMLSFLCTYGEFLPKTEKRLRARLEEGEFSTEDVVPSTLAKLLEWSEKNVGALGQIFQSSGYIPPMYKGVQIETLIGDQEKLATMMYFKMADKKTAVKNEHGRQQIDDVQTQNAVTT